MRELLEGGYPTSTPVVVAYQATWPEELVVRCTIGTLEETVKEHKLWKHTLFLVGPALDRTAPLAPVHPGHFHGFRKADPEARRALRERGAST
ncbi:Precorrin-4 C(11)-methyltransferase OS=Streptomyces fumanus OX=67302 GN=GCM10018772_64760 PE=3 SV=1 [Streptomyces fumanus]